VSNGRSKRLRKVRVFGGQRAECGFRVSDPSGTGSSAPFCPVGGGAAGREQVESSPRRARTAAIADARWLSLVTGAGCGHAWRECSCSCRCWPVVLRSNRAGSRLSWFADGSGSQRPVELVGPEVVGQGALQPHQRLQLRRGVGTVRGLNVLPKKSYATDYSYCTHSVIKSVCWRAGSGDWRRCCSPAGGVLLGLSSDPFRASRRDWIGTTFPCVDRLAQRADVLRPGAEKPHFMLRKRQFDPSRPAGELMRFVEFWHGLTGENPQWLYFDSKVTTYAELFASTREASRL